MRFLTGLCFGSALMLLSAMGYDRIQSQADTPARPTLKTETLPKVAGQEAPAQADRIAVQPEVIQPEVFEPVDPEPPIQSPTPADTAHVPETSAIASLDPELESGADMPTKKTLSVWRPFHSEMSAQGFAKRLSLQLGTPFTVSKVGPAEYHVVFSYEADSQRDLVREQLTALTGVTPQ